MSNELQKLDIGRWGDQVIGLGEDADVHLTISESYSSSMIQVPIHVRRAKAEGPVVFVTAAIHGDELNGTGAIRELIQEELELTRGSLILVPVLNLLAFDRHTRYTPDRRDLNRSFPGSASGNMASRMARTLFDQIVGRADFGIDLHTAAIRRTNYPNVRGDLSNPAVRRIATAFGSEIVLNGQGPGGALRREACQVGCPTIIMEGGEIWKVEPDVVANAARGVRNVLRDLEMLGGPPEQAPYQVIVETSKWVRAEKGGFLQFHVQPGEVIVKGQPVATNTNLLGRERCILEAPFDAVVIGMTTLPAGSPGEPVCHLGMLPEGFDPETLHQLRGGTQREAT
ncbi:succinylglutamate desuccinylase/aspartoacylase family protein [Rosistilla ulvae]|uniref:Aspartoacylase n=1 Tax=Rosistilla ulvae TaxID=1930277 RepID=A0A517LZ01_9BACT|nr:succinylglutamate desuccinylase/aspartoacylase family protein [Rosistilla ulvae]QDS87851.1 aspartoacylase [Rosistilla ulvae]